METLTRRKASRLSISDALELAFQIEEVAKKCQSREALSSAVEHMSKGYSRGSADAIHGHMLYHWLLTPYGRESALNILKYA